MASPPAPAAPPARPRLVLKARDPEAAARAERERVAALSKSSLFGAARPREATLAERSGRTEGDVLRDEARTRYRLQLRLDPEQQELKREAQRRVREAEAAAADGDAEEGELAEAKAALDELLDGFARATLESAERGEAPRVSERRAAAEAAAEGVGADSQRSGRGPPAGGEGHQGATYQPAASSYGSPAGEGQARNSWGEGGRDAEVSGGSRGFPGYQSRERRQENQGPAAAGAEGARGARKGWVDRTPGARDGARDGGRRRDGADAGAGGWERREGGESARGFSGYDDARGGARRAGSGGGYDHGEDAALPPPPAELAAVGVGGEIDFDPSSIGGGGY